MLIAMVNMGMTITDSVMVSAIFGAHALAAVAVGSDLYSILFYLGAGVLGGLVPFYTAAVVRADSLVRLRLERTGRLVVLGLALLFVPLVWTSSSWLALLGLDPSLLLEGQSYTRAMAFALFPMLGVMLYRTILTASERPKVFLQVTLAMLPLNAALNWVLMVGAGPLPALGPGGAGYSSLIVASATLVILGLVARTTTGRYSLACPGPWVDWAGAAAVMRVGLPIGIATVAEMGIFLGATLYAATLSAADVAAHTLTLRTAGLAYAIPAALLQASMVRMARAHALGDHAMQRALTSSSLMLSLGFGVVLCLTLALGSQSLANGFFDGSEAGLAAAGMASGLLMMLGIMELAMGPGSAAAGLLRGRKVTRAPMVYVLVGHWVVGAPIGIYLCEAQGLGITGVWIGLSAGTLLTTVMTLWRLFAGRQPSGPASARTGTKGPFKGDSGSVPNALANRS